MKIFNRKVKLLLILSLLFTLPISISFAILTTKTFSTYFAFDHFERPTIKKGTRLYDLGIYEFIDLKNKLVAQFVQREFEDVNLYLPSSSLNKLTEDLPKSGGNEVKSTMIIDQTVIPGKSRFRGDNYFHWLLPYQSWRLKTSKKNLYEKVRKYNFIIAKSDGLIANHMSYKLAKQLNLLAPNSSMVNLNVNNSPNGLKIMVEQIDESFLRNNGRMPNDIYKGDNIGSKGNLGISIPTMFTKASLWDKAAYNNHYDKENWKPLDTLFQNIENDRHDLLDKKSFINLMLYLDLTSSFHHDSQHNWIFYYDSYYEKFYPIIWDSLGWQPSWMAKKSIHIMHSSELMRSLYRNYDLIKEKYIQLFEFSKIGNKQFISQLNEDVKSVTEKVERLGHTFTPHAKYRDTKKTLQALNTFKTRVLERMDFVENELLGDVNTTDYSYSDIQNGIRLSINGNKLITKVKLKVDDVNHLDQAQISYYKNGEKVTIPLPYTSNKKVKSLEFNINLLATANEVIGKPFPGSRSIEFSSATYDITIDNLHNVESVSIQSLNKHVKKILVAKSENIAPISFDTQFNILQKATQTSIENWSGRKYFSGFTTIHNDINIQKGTRIILDENATLKVLGKVTAIGTKENPIVFEAKDKTKPWNAFALKDEKANGSVFKHCIFKDGSGDKGDLHEYTAMFSVHNVKDLLVEDCEFYDSQRTDDMVHIIYSDATFKNTKFVRSLSDALDVDISNLVVDNCEFIDSGNDSIDLMTTNAVVTNTKFTNSKDKGISIGEGSNLLAINNYIKGSEIGMQSKDTSQAYIYNTNFIGNKKAIDAYHKNWRYSEGGTIYLDKCIFAKNILNATVGKKSKVVINDSEIDTSDNFDAKAITKRKIIIQKEKRIHPDLKQSFFKEPIKELKHGEVEYSFFVAGHPYTRKKVGLYPPFIDSFSKINKIKELKFGVFTGDIVWLGLSKYWDQVDEDVSKINVPIYFTSGNHDIKNKKGRFDKKHRQLFINKYGKNGKSYYSYEQNGDLMIVLDPNIDKWNISGEQLKFLKNLLAENEKYKNIFVFFHQVLWWNKNNKYQKIHLNSTEDRDKNINFWSTIEPLFHNLTNQVYMFAGDTGAFQHHLPHYDVYDNIHFIASGMGGGINDNYLQVNVYEKKHVDIKLIKLQKNVEEDITKYQILENK